MTTVEGRSWTIRARVQFEGDTHVMEDVCGLAGPAAWMIDGATSVLEPIELPGASNPAWLAQTLSVALAEAVAEDAGGSGEGLRALLAAALAQVDETGRRFVGEERVRFPSAAVSVAQLNDDGVQVLALADCHVVVRLADGGVEHVFNEPADAGLGSSGPGSGGDQDTNGGTLVSDRRDSRGADPGGDDSGGADPGNHDGSDPGVHRRLLVADRELRNTPGQLWVARREPEAARQALLVQLGPPALMVMASDGAWRAVDLGLVAGPAEFLEQVATPVRALELMYRLRLVQREIGEVSDDATVLVLSSGRCP